MLFFFMGWGFVGVWWLFWGMICVLVCLFVCLKCFYIDRIKKDSLGQRF